MKSLISPLAELIRVAVNRVWNVLFSRERRMPETDCKIYAGIQARSRRRTDIADHLPTLFLEAISTEPSLIVELGVRGGESTYVFEQVSRLFGSVLVSVDLQDCSDVSAYERWHFIQEDDILFGRDFPSWCTERGLRPKVDVLFIDTSHVFEHTVEEINVWFPYVVGGGVVLLHDTNLTPWYRRMDGSIGQGWDNDRGVVRALENHLGISFNESRCFQTIAGRYQIEHHPWCNGLMVLRKLAVRYR